MGPHHLILYFQSQIQQISHHLNQNHHYQIRIHRRSDPLEYRHRHLN